ncbi:Lipase family protein [Trichomonas vaginalis G3]|uniref:sn-1-specific diacylglycerol lipase n=1 Tax=Trichomonas vaginalis (strain ATCC PRA-98 / G3) TaxID=412133 RepID=A2DT13_TRIV3|nr:lipase [Trichomonas vaginalis G3]EAY16420.1 Lipase family protein [Trichomonas vaginalis G3]KAI5505720.1 retrograde trans-synaptic signaling by lipid [Trichomonas vaginalis G3]|eukprot:XP_001328643.1 lipase [Trichomonas vaginalis G3]
MSSIFSSITSALQYAWDKAIGSHLSIKYTGVAYMALTNPTGLTFSYFFTAFMETLKDPAKCSPVKLSKAQLKYFLLLATLSSQVYQPPEERKFPEEAGEIIYEDSQSKIDKAPFVVFNSNELNKIIVAIRGSYTFADFITDLKASAIEVDGIMMHSGVFFAANALFVRIEEFIVQKSRELNRPIVFTGHSLGSGVAAISAILMKKHYPEIDVTAACFAPVASISGEEWIDTTRYITSFCLGVDPVPFLSLHNVAQVSQTGMPEIINEIIQDAVSRDVTKPILNPSDLNFEENPFESQPPTLDQIKADIKIVTRRTTALYPPGTTYHLSMEGKTFKKAKLELINNNIEYFGSFRKGMDEKHHSMDLYHDCIEELYNNS